MKGPYLALVRGIAFLENLIASVGLIFATLSTIWQIANRYWLHYEVMWVGDLTLYVFVFSVIVIIAMTTREDAHTSVDILVAHLFSGPVSSRICKILINLCSLAAILVPLPLFYKFFLRAIQYAEWGTLCPWFNTSWLIEALFVVFILCIFHILHNTGVIVLQLIELSKGKGAEAR